MTTPLASVLAYFGSFIPGQRLVDGGEVLALAKYLHGVTTGITATAGGSATAAAALSIGANRVDTVASAADSVVLPPAIPGSIVIVWNNAANSMQVFGQQPNTGSIAAGDQIVPHGSNTAAAVATGVAHASAVLGLYYCFSSGFWKQLISA